MAVRHGIGLKRPLSRDFDFPSVPVSSHRFPASRGTDAGRKSGAAVGLGEAETAATRSWTHAGYRRHDTVPSCHAGRPHFHATYGGRDASIDIESLEILAGSFLTNGLRLVRHWADQSLHGTRGGSHRGTPGSVEPGSFPRPALPTWIRASGNCSSRSTPNKITLADGRHVASLVLRYETERAKILPPEPASRCYGQSGAQDSGSGEMSGP